MRKTENLDFAGAFEQAFIQYKANFTKLIGYGLLASIPPLFFSFNITVAVALTLVLEGFLMVVLANSIICSARGLKNDSFAIYNLLRFFKNGFLISILLFPLLTISLVAFVLPSLLLFSLFMFSFFIVPNKQKFAVDALMESLREGNGHRFPLFLFSLIFYGVITLLVLFSQLFWPSFVILGTFLLPYLFSVIYELYDQLEKK